MNAICKEIIQSMEETKTSIASFIFAFTLKGKAYDSAKSFMAQTYFPLAQGIIYLCEELIQQNEGYPSDFRSEVAPTDVIEQEILDQIKVIEGIIARLRALSNTVPLLSVSIVIYEAMKRKLEEKLERLYTFNGTSASNYEHAMDLAGEVAKGLTELENGKGFNSASGTFSTEGMDMDWATNIDKIHYEKLAHDLYPEYAGESDENLEKVIAIIKYEELNPKYVDQTNEFLSPLEEQDIVEIKYLIYTAEEPYRTLAMKYLDRFNIGKTDSGGLFKPSQDEFDFNVEKDRDNDRGNYYTFFHEIMHAADYYYGIDQGYDGYYSDYYHNGYYSFIQDGKNIELKKDLNYYMYNDARTHFDGELSKEIQNSKYDHFSSDEKQSMIDNVADNLMIQDDNYADLSPEERDLNNTIRSHYEDLLRGPAHNTASDVYGGITNFVISGNYGHQEEDGSPSDYWFIDAIGGVDGERRREPNREGIAEYFGRIMTDEREAGIESIEEFLPTSKEFMDEIFDTMVE